MFVSDFEMVKFKFVMFKLLLNMTLIMKNSVWVLEYTVLLRRNLHFVVI